MGDIVGHIELQDGFYLNGEWTPLSGPICWGRDGFGGWASWEAAANRLMKFAGAVHTMDGIEVPGTLPEFPTAQRYVLCQPISHEGR